MTHRLLLVEDSPLQAELLRDDLVASGYDVTVTVDGEAALAYLAEHRPDVVVSDVMMPGMTGYELCRSIKSTRELTGVPVLLLTTLRDPVDIVRGLEAGADNFLTKPYDLPQLLHRLDTVLRSPDRQDTGRFRMGVEVQLLGHTFTVNTDRQQILDMLMSSFEDLIHTNARLREREQELQQARDELTAEVEQSERRRRQLALKENELRLTIEAAGVATWRLSLPEGRFEWSENARALYRLSSDASIEDVESWLELLHPDDRPALATLAEEVITAGTELPDEWEYRITGEDGVTRTFSGRGEIEDRSVDGVTVSGVAIDITRQRELADELHLREQMLRAVLAASPDAILVTGTDGLIQFASERVRDVVGLDPDEVVGRPTHEFLAEDSHHSLYRGTGRGQLQEAGFIDRLRLGVRHADGHLVTLDARIGELTGPQGDLEGHVTVLRDVTEQARLEAELEEAKEEADAANRAKSDYLSRMSHELRTPMNTVLGFSQLLQLSELDPEDHENVERILRAGRHLLGLIDDVLDIARIESGSMQISLEPVAIGTVVGEAVELIQPQARERDITVDLPDDCGSWPYAHADRQRLSQVIINLLSNAVKYNRPGGEIQLSCTEVAEGRHRVAVADTGYGIAEEELDRVFTPFDRLGADRGQVTGTGLGLALSRHLAEAMGGEMGCESTLGEGSVFWVDLPEAPAPAGTEEEPDAGTEGVEEQARLAGTVLYIEDNPMNLELVRRVFARSHDLELLHAATGEEGIGVALERRPDLVLLDLHLQGASGRDVLRDLRRREATRDLPIVVVSADATTTSRAELLAAGADGYVTKPFDLTELRQVVARMLVEGRGDEPSGSARERSEVT